ncbi:MAG TPA: hypothetical protein VFQ44_16680 [Streptosporangiaceae bacterium]|nr:hypothetical protein [Streptosporangiaceae bacterium]
MRYVVSSKIEFMPQLLSREQGGECSRARQGTSRVFPLSLTAGEQLADY